MFNNWNKERFIINGRVAVALVFFVNGLLYASWTSRVPELTKLINVNNAELGSLLFVIAAGAIIAMPIAGWLTTKIGSSWLTRITSIGFCLSVPLLVASSNLFTVTIFFFALGLFGGALDVSMNGQAVLVERKWLSSIMSSFHAMFSIGMAIGAGLGAVFAMYHIELLVHLTIMAAIGIIIFIWAGFQLLPEEKIIDPSKTSSGFAWPTMAILPLGIIAFCGFTGEGAIVDWSALFMRQTVGGNEFMSALTVGSFATSMTIGRLFGDYVTDKLGRIRMLITSSVLSILGLAIALIFLNELTTLSGFFLAGLGLANVVPIIYSTAGNTKGVQPSTGIAMVSTLGYSGFFVGPPVIGYLSELYNLRIGLSFALLLLLVMFLLIIVLRKKVI